MINTLLKVAAEQILDSRSALEQPIAHLKYGLLGGLAAAIAVSMGVAALSAALFFWLTANGLSVVNALVVTGVFLIMQAVLVWLMSNYLCERQANASEDQLATSDDNQSRQDPMDEIKALGVMLVREAAEGFIEGLKTNPKPLIEDDDSNRSTGTVQHEAAILETTEIKIPKDQLN